MKYVFGPVPSRRLGRSLGVDTIPLKTCSWNCSYCQIGTTNAITVERKEYFPREDILAELKEVIDQKGDSIDWISFVGSGEPTLHIGIGDMIRQIKEWTSIPIAIITNGTLLHLPEMRKELALADTVMPTLSVGSEKLYRKLHHPHPDATLTRLVEGIRLFREEYKGKLWIEVMLVKDLNDNEEALHDLAEQIRLVDPDEIHIVLPTRPPNQKWIAPADEDGLLLARAILGEIAKVRHPKETHVSFTQEDDLHKALLGIIARHPMSWKELKETLSVWPQNEVEQALHLLESKNQAIKVERYNTQFWRGNL